MIRLSALLLLIATVAPLRAADGSPAPAAAAKPYPLTTCLVSGEKLGEMGESPVLVQDGQEYKFCCNSCIKEFKKDPKKFADKLAAAEAKDKAAAPAAKPEEASPKAK